MEGLSLQVVVRQGSAWLETDGERPIFIFPSYSDLPSILGIEVFNTQFVCGLLSTH